MNNIFEKITLYDILGYGFPGFFFILMILTMFFDFIPYSLIVLWKEYDGFLVASIVVLSHIMGTVLSEIAKYISKFFSNSKCSYLSLISCDIDSIITSLNSNGKDKKRYNEGELSSAFKNANVSFDSTIDIRSMGYIYSVIQADINFSRIHTYASAAVMCRNTATACLIGSGLSIVLVIRSALYSCIFSANIGILVVCLLGCAFLLYARSRRFEEKKFFYAINWFIYKYMGSTGSEIDQN